MSNFLIIFLCLVFGYLLRYFNITKKDGHLSINSWVIYVGLPAVALKYIPQIEWELAYLYTALLPILCFSLSYIFFSILNRWTNFSKRTLNTIIIVAGLSNTSFIGFPLVSTFYGQDYLKVAIVSDQVTFFTLSFLGVFLATSSQDVFISNRQKYTYIAKRLLQFPPLIACIVALFFSKFLIHKEFVIIFDSFAATVSPLALFSIGMQLNFQRINKEIIALTYGVLFKIVMVPIIFILLFYFLGLHGVFFKVSIFEMALPCLVSSSIIIEKFGLNSKLANSLIGFSILFGLLIIYVWYSVMNTLL